MIAELTDLRHVYALDIARVLATGAYPAEATRIGRAGNLVRSGMVHLQGDGTATVEGSCDGTIYTVNGACTCKDVEFNDVPGGRCKHRFAVALAKRVDALMGRQWVATDAVSGEGGIATEVYADADFRASAWVFQGYDNPIPRYRASTALVLGHQLELGEN